MFEKYSVKNYGINDLATGMQFKNLLEDLKSGRDEFYESVLSVVQKEPTSILDYESLLKIKVVFEYRELIKFISNEELKKNLIEFYTEPRIQKISNNELKAPIIRFINLHATEIFSNDDYDIKNETLKLCVTYTKGIQCWNEIINTTDDFLLRSHFDSIFEALKSTKIKVELVKKVLFPLSIRDFDQQIEITMRIEMVFEEEYKKFKEEIILFLDSAEFKAANNIVQIKFMKDVLGYRILGLKGEIFIKERLNAAEEILNKSKGGYQTVTNSEKYAELETICKDFSDKFYFLTYIELFSIYQFMQYESKDVSMLDFVTNIDLGTNHGKYSRGSFFVKFRKCKTQFILNTMYLMGKYKANFWQELIMYAEKVQDFTGISPFLKAHLTLVERLLNEKDYFSGSLSMSLIIERFLREIYLKLTYDVVGIFKEARFTLGDLLRFDLNTSNNKLRLLFSKEELETMDYFLTNNDYGMNMRNNLAHYNINAEDVDITYFSILMHIFIFILVKIDYQGLVFEK
ncbi:hypothetical protein P343_09875 [Sporolactobacillus laevolacticus DSM 442]|uniref:DUF4209 domain-containing protein n=1 Tax=Sporolactobacillus laevolacticus DSM 442 TaxID=1395513 RepID=V6IXH1_9BACL|nr:hypothetical protein P343_09875 [Sporolactobacillus laevolacticus DSM 442]